MKRTKQGFTRLIGNFEKAWLRVAVVRVKYNGIGININKSNFVK